jgi:mono/diheme cytochrome c family protein
LACAAAAACGGANKPLWEPASSGSDSGPGTASGGGDGSASVSDASGGTPAEASSPSQPTTTPDAGPSSSPSAGTSSDGGGVPYLDDASYRRSELVASLVNPQNQYSQQRLAHYATGDSQDWDQLPEWNPPVDVLATSELDAPGGASATTLSPNAAPLTLPDSVASEDDPALVTLGEQAFHRYPAQPATYLRGALGSRDAATRYGLWLDDTAGLGGLVRARMADGTGQIALTCASCHTGRVGGTLVTGRANARLDIGSALLAGENFPPGSAQANAIAAWGPGRLDVTTTAGTEPVRIPDVRPVRWLTYLLADGTIVQRNRTVTAIRTETLIITANSNALRPPRVVALALAAYVASLADALPALDAATQAFPAGAKVFATNCTSCHVSPGLTGPPVPLDVVGTDPTLGKSAVRGTGDYRVPSLHGVGTRGPLLHDGTVPDLDAMFDPSRTTPAFTRRLHGQGAVEGHPFGLDLSDADRAALIAFLKAL